MVSMVLFSESDQLIVGAEKIEELFGYTSEEVTGNHFGMLFSSNYKELTPQLSFECLINKKPMLIEGKRKNESIFLLTMLVTETQTGIRGQSVLVASLFPLHVELGVFTINKSGIIIASSSKTERIFDRPLAEMRDKHIRNFIPALTEGFSFTGGLNTQMLGVGGNGQQISLWVSLESEANRISTEIFHLNVEDLSPDMDMEAVLQIDSSFTIIDTSRYFIFHLLGYLNSELLGEDIHNLIDHKDLDNKVNIPVRDSNSNSNKRQKVEVPQMSFQFVPSAARVMLKNKAGFLTPFNMHVSPYNAKTDRFCVYIKPVKSTVVKPPDEVSRLFSDHVIQTQIDNGECGSYTTVFSALSKSTGELKAVKLTNKKMIDESQRVRLLNEYQIARSLKHPNIIRYLDQFETENYVCTVMEFGKDGSLESYKTKKNRLTEEEALKFFIQLVEGLAYCHSQKCVHGDIKLNNAVLSDGVCKLIDFNMAKRFDEENVDSAVLKRTTFCGTSLYIAPEMVLNKDYEGHKADIWSLGIALYVLVTGNYPFDSIAESLMSRPALPSFLSENLCDLLKSILTVDTKKRLTLDQIQNHPWIVSAAKALPQPPLNNQSSSNLILPTTSDSANNNNNLTTTSSSSSSNSNSNSDHNSNPPSDHVQPTPAQNEMQIPPSEKMQTNDLPSLSKNESSTAEMSKLGSVSLHASTDMIITPTRISSFNGSPSTELFHKTPSSSVASAEALVPNNVKANGHPIVPNHSNHTAETSASTT